MELLVWKPDYVAECDGCEVEKRVMDCAELGDLCRQCFDESELGVSLEDE